MGLMAVVVSGLLLLGACSSDDGDDSADDTVKETTTTEAEAIAFADWQEAADELCEESDEAIAELPEIESTEDFADVGPDALEIAQDQYDEMVELGLPDEQADVVEEVLELLEEQLALTEDLIAAAEEGDEDAVEEILAEGTELEEQLADLADDLELEVCGQDSGETDVDTTDTTDSDTTSGDTTVFDTGDPLVDVFAQATYDELLVQGFNDEEANCIVAGVLDAFTVEELVAASQSGDTSQIQSVTTDVTLDCVSVERLAEIGGQ
jgi:hypothetical protein